MSIPYLSKAGHVQMAKASQRQLLQDAKRGLWGLAGQQRTSRDWHLMQARTAI